VGSPYLCTALLGVLLGPQLSQPLLPVIGRGAHWPSTVVKDAFCVCVKPRWWMAAAAPGSVRICSSGAALCGCAQHHASFRHRGLQHPPLHFCRERAMRDFITIAACLGAAAADHTDFDGWNAGQITSVRCVLTFGAHRVSPGAFLAPRWVPRWCSAWRSSRLCRSQEPELQITFQVENCENCECRKQGTGQKRGPEGADLKGNCPRVHKIIRFPFIILNWQFTPHPGYLV
jgi:hypothetical protein